MLVTFIPIVFDFNLHTHGAVLNEFEASSLISILSLDVFSFSFFFNYFTYYSSEVFLDPFFNTSILEFYDFTSYENQDFNIPYLFYSSLSDLYTY